MLSFFSLWTRRAALAVMLFLAGLVMASAALPTLSIGIVKSGGAANARPLSGAGITVFEATSLMPKVVARTKSNAAGQFWFNVPPDSVSGIYYATADFAGGVQLVTILGASVPATFTINELTTVAAGYSMAQFYTNGSIAGTTMGLRIAAGMNDNLVTVATGESSSVMLNSPNADESNSLRSTRSLANVLAACLQNSYYATAFFSVATPLGGGVPPTTAQALANLARNPALNVGSIYFLSQLVPVYQPALAVAPDVWTIAVKVNDSGDDNLLIAGVGNIVFDSRGLAWVTNNTVQGTPYSGAMQLVFQPNGKPCDGTNGTPISPITGGGLLGPGYGVTLDPRGYVWVGNLGWGGIKPSPYPPGNGSVSLLLQSNGQPLSGLGYYGYTERAQSVAVDAQGNLWVASLGNNRLCVYLYGNPAWAIYYQLPDGSTPFDVHIAKDGSAWLTHTGSKDASAGISKYWLVGTKLYQQFFVPVGQAVKGMDLDSYGTAWFGSQDSFVYGVRPDGSVLGPFNGGGIDTPWSVTIDREDNIWCANFGSFRQPYNDARVSKICGLNPATRPAGFKVGDPLTPATGYNLPSAGSPVLLHNGELLYGPGSLPAYTPLMRMTKVGIDQAGNLWALNNWKPRTLNDLFFNPGGDGIVIFVGMAPPAKAP